LKKLFLILSIIIVLGNCAIAATQTISLNISDKTVIPAKNLTRFVCVDQNIAQTLQFGDGIELTGVAPGDTYLHLWDDFGMRTFKIEVRYAKYKSTGENVTEAQTQYDPINVKFITGAGSGNSSSPYSANNWGYNYTYSQFGLSGDTQYGKSVADVQFETRDAVREVSYINTGIKNGLFDLKFGNNYGNYSPLTMPSTNYEGLTLKTSIAGGNFDFVRGSEGYTIWGSQVKSDLRPASYFTLIRGSYSPNNIFTFNATGIQLDKTAVRDAGAIFDIEGVGNLTNNLRVAAEIAKSDTSKAAIGNVTYRTGQFSFSGTYRDIGAAYNTVYDMVSYKGMKGSFLSATYTPFRYITLSGNYDRYLARLFNPNYNNTDTNLNLDIDIPVVAARLSASKWLRDRLGYGAQGGISEGTTYQLTQKLKLNNKGTAFENYLRYQGSTYSIEYALQQLTVGTRFYFIPQLYMEYEREFDTKLDFASNTSGPGRIQKGSVGYTNQLFAIPLYATIIFSSQTNTGSTLGLEKLEKSANLNLEYKPSDNLRAYLRGVLTDISGPAYEQIDRSEKDIHFGLAYNLNTGVYLKPTGTVNGIVFTDLNGNGTRDKGEPAVSGASIYLGSEECKTDLNGYYRFERIPAEKNIITLDMTTVPKNYISTQANPAVIDIRPMSDNNIDFGIIPNTRIVGMVFYDANGNSIFDKGDIPIPNAIISFRDADNMTNSSGSYVFTKLPKGTGSLKLDIMSLPSKYSIIKDAETAIYLEDGKSYTVNYPVYTLKTVTGVIYIDSNGDGKFEETENRVANVEISIGPERTVTDANGRYMFKDIKSYNNKVVINTATLPKGYRVEAASKTIKFTNEKEIAKIDFGLRTKSGNHR